MQKIPIKTNFCEEYFNVKKISYKEYILYNLSMVGAIRQGLKGGFTIFCIISAENRTNVQKTAPAENLRWGKFQNLHEKV